MRGLRFPRRLLGRRQHEHSGSDGDSAAGDQSALDLADIQGFILRAYRMPMVRHFLLAVGTPAHARRQLGRLVSGDEVDAPQITTAEDWHVGFAPGPGDNPADPPRRKPDYCLNIGITWPGLVALEIGERVPTLSLRSFGAFVEGAAQRAELIGDTGASSPENWVGGFGSGDDHVLVTLHAISPEAMSSYSDRLCALFAERDAFREIWRQDGMALIEIQDGQPVPTARVHFGYTDGISTPTIRGGPEHYQPDHQQPCEPWLFVLREDAEIYDVPEPRALGLNGSFAVFKKVETDVVGFEDFLQSNRDRIDPELLAAKMCGRWRNGVPLALSPDTDSPAEEIRPRAVERLRVRERRRFWRSEGDPLSRRRTHTPCQSARPANRGPRSARRQQQFAPAGSSRPAVRADLRSREALRRHRARDALSVHQREHREPIRVRAATVGQRQRIRRGRQASPEIERSPDLRP